VFCTVGGSERIKLTIVNGISIHFHTVVQWFNSSNPFSAANYINSADLFILCWSENAAKSAYVEKERNQALDRAYPKVKPIEKAPLFIYPLSIKPRTELPEDMKSVYNF